MSFFSKTVDKINRALGKTRDILFTDVRTLFVPGRQIDEAFLNELEERFVVADMGGGNARRIVDEVRQRWRLGRIRNAQEAESVVREQMLANWPTGNRELRFAP